MASQTEICNRAGILLGCEALITNISDNSKPARTFNALWNTVRKEELCKHYWGFSLSRTQLAALSSVPSWGFGASYQLPSDYLKMVQVNDVYASPGLVDYRQYDDSPYAIEGQTISCDYSAPLKIRYVSDIQDSGLFPPAFVGAFSARLAYLACYTITQSNQRQDACMQEYNLALAEARRSGAVEKPPQGIPDDSWLLGRI